MEGLIEVLPVLVVGAFLSRRLAGLDRRLGAVEQGLGDVALRLARLEGRIQGWQDRRHPPVRSGGRAG